MKVVFIGKSEIYGKIALTYGKSYENLNTSDSHLYFILNDLGHEEFYPKTIFITLEEWRERKLNGLGI